MIDLRRWLQTGIAGRFTPPKNQYNHGDPRSVSMIMKMGVGAATVELFWDSTKLNYCAVIINIVSSIYGEAHPGTYPPLIGGKNYTVTSADELKE